MKIGIEGQRLFRKKKHGMDIVALELIRNLQQIDHENEYMIFIKPDEDDSVLKETHNFTIVKLEGGFYPLWEQVALPHAARQAGCDVLHCTSNTAPVLTDIPLVVTLHDIISMESSYVQTLSGSGTSYQKFGSAYRKLFVPRVVKKCHKIITVSHFEKNRIEELFKMQGDPRLTVVYNGVSEHFVPVSNKAELNRVKKKYHLPDLFFTFLANTDPKKNTRNTLIAFSDFIHRTGSHVQLVMLDYDRSELEKLLEDIGDASLTDHIVLPGYIANCDLPAIYSQCEVFLYPSLRESFGIPILEAMACGVPVITSNTSSMPEVSGSAALLVDPHDPGKITDAMARLASDGDLRRDLTGRGILQAAEFSWKAMAERVLEIYQEVGSKHSR